MRVPGIGPRPCRTLWIGEAPGAEEDRVGKPFVGKAGGELNRHLNGHSLPAREDIYLTNLVKERPPNNADPTQGDIERDEPELWAELAEVKPEVIVTLGRISTRYFLGDVDMEMVHGIPQRLPSEEIPGGLRSRVPYALVGSDGELFTPMIFPCYHPAAGLHAPELAALFVYDLQRLSALLKGKLLPAAVDQWTGREQYRVGLPEPCDLTSVVAMDTEGLPGCPWGLSFSDMPGEAYVVKAGAVDQVARLREALRCG